MRNRTVRRAAFCMLFIICLLLILPACAEGLVSDLKKSEETDGNASGQFSFRAGVTWEMTVNDVQQLENETMVERRQKEWTVLYLQNRVSVSNYYAYLAYIFHQDKLRMIMYEFENEPDSSFLYLTGALDSVYGAEKETTARDVMMIMDQLYPGRYTDEQLKNVISWSAPDGTRIFLYSYAENAFAILYASPETAEAGNYNTQGL